MSERNGDRSLFGRKRKAKIQRRLRNRELRASLGLAKPATKAKA